jgi:type IV secretion system protein VirB5
MRALLIASVLFTTALAFATPARAQFAVIDVATVAQLVEQLVTLEEQLTAMREHLAQARSEYAAITGTRGMERLLAGQQRNYLPSDWDELAAAIEGEGSTHAALTTAIKRQTEENRILTEDEVAALAKPSQRELFAGRKSAATLQALAREALAMTSARFESLQTLIDAIPEAEDQKAILDLQARIGAEQSMLLNEANKLHILFQTQQAEEGARRQRQREQAIADIGSLKALSDLKL